MEEIYIHIPEGWEVKIENGDVIISPPSKELSKIEIDLKKDEHLQLQKIAQELYVRHYRLPNQNKNQKLQQFDYYRAFYEIAKETERSPIEIAEEMLRETIENERK